MRPLDVGIIIDQTLTLGTDNWASLLGFLKTVVNGLGVSAAPDGTRVGLIRFTSKPITALYFSTIRDKYLRASTVNQYIDRIAQMQGERRIDRALLSAASDLFSIKEGSRPNAKRVRP